MAYPVFQQKLFQNDGGGDKLKPAIMPDEVVRSDKAQTLTDAQKLQAATNIGLIESIDSLITSYGGTVPSD